ncbi:MAG: pyridoxamine 5'-phosphate oxidase family protein [Anaerolineae bacterium]
MKRVQFSEIVEEFVTAAHQQVWCAVGTVDPQNRPHVRLLHPIWEHDAGSATGWILTNRHSPKEKHIAHSSYASLCYDRDVVKPITIDCEAVWADTLDDTVRIWERFKREPEPLGYDPALIWKTPDNPDVGLLKLTPYRIILGHLGVEWRVWTREQG